VRKISPDGTISTVAGTGQGCCFAFDTGDGGPASAAPLYYPYQLAVDPKGNVYLGESNRGCIRQVSADGIIRTVVGACDSSAYSGDGGPAAKAQIGAPWGLAFDAAGNLYISDAVPGEDGVVATHIRKVTPDGIISTIAGTGDVGFAGDGGPALNAQLSSPGALAATSSGDVYVADGARIRKISAHGTIATIAGNGTSGYSGDGGPATQAAISGNVEGQWLGLAADTAGNLYIADTLNLRVREVTTGGAIATVAGNGHTACCFSGDVDLASTAQLYAPVGVAAAPDSSLYVSDTYNDRIRRIDPRGFMTTVSGAAAWYLSPPQLLGTPPLA
jgi:trimeric autotransporter adhesin